MAKANIPAWDTTAANNTDVNSISTAENVMTPGTVNNAFREIMAEVASYTRRGADTATAATLNLDATPNEFLDLTGTVTVTAVTLTDKHNRRARAQGAFQLTASASLIVNGSTTSNYTTTAGDLLFFEGYSAGVVRVWTTSGGATAFSKGADIASAGTISISTASNFYHVTGTTTITDIDFSPATNGSWAWLEFDGVLTLTNNSTTLTLPGGANITTAAGDRALFVQDNGDNVHCMAYTRAATKPDKDYELVASLSASASSAINFDSSNSITIADGYDYIIKCIEVKPSADCNVSVQYGTGGTPTYQTTGYTQQASTQFNATTNTVRDGITTGIQVTTGMGGTSAGETFDAEITITRPGANSIHKMWSTFVGFATDGLINTAFTGGWRSTSEVLTGIRISPSTGSFTTGTFALYRRKVA